MSESIQEPIRIELPTIFENMSVNAWLFKYPEPVLIDCGEKTDASWVALEKGLAQQGLTIQDIKKVIITHAHLDHIGMANKITEHSEATIWVSEYVHDWAINLEEMLDKRTETIVKVSRANLPESFVYDHFSFGYDKLSPYWEEIPAERLRIFSIHEELNFGGQAWKIIYTPGHCINQTCFFQEESGYLLSADMLLKMIPIPIIDAKIENPEERVHCLKMQLTSYQSLLNLDIKKVFPGHYDIFDNAHKVIQQQIDKIQERKAACLELIQNEKHDFLDIWQNVYGRRMNPATFFMIVGLLDLLLEEEKVEAREEEGILKYFLLADK